MPVCTGVHMYAPPCVRTTNPSHATACYARRGGKPPHPPSTTKHLRWLQTAFCVHRLVCAPPCVYTALCVHCQPLPRHGSLRSMQGPAPAPPLNNKTLAVAIDRLVCAPPGVCTALCGRQCLRTTDRNSYDPRVNGRGIRVNGVAFGVKCAYSCILGAFGVLRSSGPWGCRRGGGGGQSSHIPYICVCN